MDLYGLLTKLVINSTMPEPDQVAAREVIKHLKGVNAFGTVVAATTSDSAEVEHTHRKVTMWADSKGYSGKYIDVCEDCGEDLSPPYEPKWQGRKW